MSINLPFLLKACVSTEGNLKETQNIFVEVRPRKCWYFSSLEKVGYLCDTPPLCTISLLLYKKKNCHGQPFPPPLPVTPEPSLLFAQYKTANFNAYSIVLKKLLSHSLPRIAPSKEFVLTRGRQGFLDLVWLRCEILPLNISVSKIAFQNTYNHFTCCLSASWIAHLLFLV